MVSHDRGCPCGKEKGEYNSCTDSRCFKKVKSIAEQIKDYAEKANESEKNMIERNKKYVWIRANGDVKLIDDPVAVWLSDEFDKDSDQIFSLGNEIEVNFSIDIKNKTVHRDNASGYRTNP